MSYYTAEKHAISTGYSLDAIYKKIKRGVWPEEIVWIKAPDGRILINKEGFEAWAEGRVQNTTASEQHQKHQSKSISTITDEGANRVSKASPPPLTLEGPNLSDNK